MAKVLLVDDHRDVCEMLAELLRSHGHSVRGCGSAEAAMQELSQHSSEFDVVVADDTLPGISGLQLLREIRDNPTVKPVPVIICSAADSVRDHAQRGGALDFWLKGSDQLFDAVQRLEAILRSAG